MREINGDGNLEALRRYEAQIDDNERAYEAYLSDMNDEIGCLIDEIIERHREINDKYGFEDKLITFIEER